MTWPNAQVGDLPVPADYNGDGTIDEALYRPSTGQSFFTPGDVTGTTFGVAGATPVPADYNGDGSADIAYYDATTGDWHMGNGTSIASPTVSNLGGPGYIPVPGNYDGVVGADKGVYKKSTGQWFLNNLTTVSGAGQVGDVPATADYNGDGRQDIARYRGGYWLINQNHNAVYADTSIAYFAGPGFKAVAQPYAITSQV